MYNEEEEKIMSEASQQMSFQGVDPRGYRRKEAPRKRGFEGLDEYIDFEEFRPYLAKLCKYKEKGRSHYDEVKMFKIMLMQQQNNLSDEAMEDMLYDSMSYQRFAGIGVADDIPDARTIWLFRQRLGAKGIKLLFAKFNRMMKEAGLEYSRSTLIDATFFETPRQHFTSNEKEDIKQTGEAPQEWSEKKKVHKDLEAQTAKKRCTTYHGYKGNVAVNARNKMVTAYIITKARRHDSKTCATLVGEGCEYVYADSGYMGKPVENELGKKGVKARIMRHRVKNQTELSEQDKKRNKRISRIRCRVEHIFGAVEKMGGKLVRYVGKGRCSAKVGLQMLYYNMKRFAYLVKENPPKIWKRRGNPGSLCPQS